MSALGRLNEADISPVPDNGQREELSQVVPQRVDRVMNLLSRVKEKLESRKIDLVELLGKVISLHKEPCKQDGVSLNLQSNLPPKLRLFGNGPELTNAFSELLTNARKHAFPEPPGKGEKKIAVHLNYEDDSKQNLEVKISDNGVGIPPEQLNKIEYRGISSRGSGEGIPLVKRIIAGRHLGSLRFHSRPGQGTVAEVLLPIKLSLEA